MADLGGMSASNDYFYEWKLFAVCIYLFQDHEPLDITRCLYSIKMDGNVVCFNGKHSTEQ